MLNNSPTPIIVAQKAIILHTVGVQVRVLGRSLVGAGTPTLNPGPCPLDPKSPLQPSSLNSLRGLHRGQYIREYYRGYLC